MAALPEELHLAARDKSERLSQFQEREDAEVSRLRAAIEVVSRFFASPACFVFVLVSIVLFRWRCDI
jgi:hypothetical protein